MNDPAATSTEPPSVEPLSTETAAPAPAAASPRTVTVVKGQPIMPGTEWIVRRLGSPLLWSWRKGFRFLFLLDAVALFGSMVLINVVRFGVDWPTYPLSHYWVGFSIATTIHLVIGYFVGLYEREPRLGQRAWLPRVALAMAIGVAVQGIASVLLDRYLMPRVNLAILLVLGSVVITANRRLSRRLALRRQGPPLVALVGPADAIDTAERHLADSDRAAVVVARAETTDNLVDLVRHSRATDVLLLDVKAFGEIFPEPLSSLETMGIGFLQRVGAQETLLGLQAVREVAGMPFVRLDSHTLPSHKLRLKRGLDLALLAIGAPIAIPVLAILTLYVLLRSGTPIFYRQVRIGRAGHEFSLVKFRTMRRDAEQHGAVLATARDPRVVRGLGWMRATRADELPQLWNVLKGEMSLVGPRPERPEFTEELAIVIPGYDRRHELPPGLTGLAQVQGRYDTDAVYKVGYDLQYLVNWSPVLDLQILLRTIWVVVMRRV
jgi:exopolysaccharide biosynthesis polyprenyl glycosylphosphotransferase